MEREEKRRTREAAKSFKEQQKMQAIEDAEYAVEQWKDYVELLQTTHKSCTDPVDWQEFLDTPKHQKLLFLQSLTLPKRKTK